jgi:hypothetical protein
MAYATTEDVEEQWRDFSEVETARAEALLDLAAILIDRRVTFTGLSDDPLLTVAKQVSIEMVIDAVAVSEGKGARGKSSYTVTVDGAVESATLSKGGGSNEPSWVLMLTEGMLALFGVSASPEPKYYFGDCLQ